MRITQIQFLVAIVKIEYGHSLEYIQPIIIITSVLIRDIAVDMATSLYRRAGIRFLAGARTFFSLYGVHLAYHAKNNRDYFPGAK
jgi:predicted lipase